MSQSIEALSSLTKLTSYTPVDIDNSSVSVHDNNFNNLVSSAFSKISETNSQYKDIINSLSHSEGFSSDPKTLIRLQGYLAEFTNYTALVGTLARKGVATIETLVKSQ